MTRARLSAYTAAPAVVINALDALRAKHQIPPAFPDDALAEAAQAAAAWADGGPARLLAQGARDARDLPLVTIDPPGSKDLDQAVFLERLAPGPADAPARNAPESRAVYRVHYAIASLATFVTPGGALDAELRRRGETVYAPDNATPLHPEILSHGAASLLEGQERPACLWTIDLDSAGEVVDAGVERALVRSRARLTYAQVQNHLDDPHSHPLPQAVPAGLAQLLQEIGRLRQACEAARGGISLARPEQEIEPIGEGAVTGAGPDGGPEAAPGDAGAATQGYRLVYRSGLPVEGYNAQISLLTGICAARMMLDAKVGILRTMPPAEKKDYQRLRRVAHALRIEWPRKRSYPDLVRSLDHNHPAHAAFLNQALSLFRGAGYLALLEAAGHTAQKAPGLAQGRAARRAKNRAQDLPIHAAIAAPYAHVTAPLRRLVDRYGLEVCLALSAGEPVPDWVARALPDLPETMATTGKRAKAVSRGAVSALEALVLCGHEGQIFEGVITSVRQGVGELMLAEPAVISAVHAPALPPDGVAKRLPLGERVQARLEQADPLTGRTEFGLV